MLYFGPLVGAAGGADGGGGVTTASVAKLDKYT